MSTTKNFNLGEITGTPEIVERMKDKKFKQFCYASLGRHQYGDWGDIDPQDAEDNDQALENNELVVSTYRYMDGVTSLVVDDITKIRIMTNAARTKTTILLVGGKRP